VLDQVVLVLERLVATVALVGPLVFVIRHVPLVTAPLGEHLVADVALLGRRQQAVVLLVRAGGHGGGGGEVVRQLRVVGDQVDRVLRLLSLRHRWGCSWSGALVGQVQGHVLLVVLLFLHLVVNVVGLHRVWRGGRRDVW